MIILETKLKFETDNIMILQLKFPIAKPVISRQ